MFSSLKNRHWKILGSVIVSVFLGISTFLGVATAKRVVSDSGYEREKIAYDQQTNLNEMWQVIDGSVPRPPGVDSYALLAERLSVVVDEAGTSADITSESYSAPPRTYRGITEEIGFDPFVSELCNECGDLSQFMVERLRDIKEGRVSSLLSHELEAPINEVTWSLTGLPFGIELLIAWQVFGALGMLWGLSRYGDKAMTWRFRDGEYDGLEWACLVFAPAFMITFLSTWNRRANKRNEEARAEMLRAMGLSDILHDIEDAQKRIRELPENIRNRREVQVQYDRLERARLDIRDKPDELQARQLGIATDGIVRDLTTSLDAKRLLDAAEDAYEGYLKAIEEVNEITHGV